LRCDDADPGYVVLLPTVIAAASIRIGEFVRSQRLSELICGTDSVAVLDAPADWSHVSAEFSSFSPKGDRLAVVYAGKIPRGEWRTLIEIWNTDIARKVASRCALVLKAPR